ncbi:pyridoxamine 5'-phosphate oxidase family protein [Candidatus Thorarchaeota archaeon]|nr:MAG: pyridoxamine 5'-phosphate oxidase family protein [Candidatus Thorarchaeota archaeon]
MSSKESSGIKFIDRELRRIDFDIGGLTVSFPLNAIPDQVYEAMASAIHRTYSSEQHLTEIYVSTLMKPTVSTLNSSNIFPINSAKKIIRLTLTDEEIIESIHELEGAVLAFQGRPFRETMDERIELYQKILLDDKKIDRFRFGAVEMFGDQTYQNIKRDPRVTLNLFWAQDTHPEARSFQINCVAEIVQPGDPFFRYMRLMRQLFSSRLLNLRGTGEYICAYKFWVCESKDKSLEEKTGFVP